MKWEYYHISILPKRTWNFTSRKKRSGGHHSDRTFQGHFLPSVRIYTVRSSIPNDNNMIKLVEEYHKWELKTILTITKYLVINDYPQNMCRRKTRLHRISYFEYFVVEVSTEENIEKEIIQRINQVDLRYQSLMEFYWINEMSRGILWDKN